MSEMAHLYAGVPVPDLEAGIDWSTRFFGRPPDFRAGNEMPWEIDEHATLFIEPDAARDRRRADHPRHTTSTDSY